MSVSPRPSRAASSCLYLVIWPGPVDAFELTDGGPGVDGERGAVVISDRAHPGLPGLAVCRSARHAVAGLAAADPDVTWGMRRPGTACPGRAPERLPALLVMVVLFVLAVGGLLAGGCTVTSMSAGRTSVNAAASAMVLQPVVASSHRLRPVAVGRMAAVVVRGAAHASAVPAVGDVGRTDRASAGSPLLLWAPAVVLPAGPPLLTGQLPRPPTAPSPRTDLVALRGRAPPGPAGT